MRRVTSYGALALCTALTMACNSNRTAQANNDTGANAPAAAAFKDNNADRPAPVDVTGCLTASGDRFVLTTLQAEAGPTTETYQLISAGTADLAKYVGQQVHVTGEAAPAQVADVREVTPAAPAPQGSVGTTGATPPNGANAPKVSTEERTRFEVRTLRVSSVTGAGGSCPSAETQSR